MTRPVVLFHDLGSEPGQRTVDAHAVHDASLLHEFHRRGYYHSRTDGWKVPAMRPSRRAALAARPAGWFFRRWLFAGRAWAPAVGRLPAPAPPPLHPAEERQRLLDAPRRRGQQQLALAGALPVAPVRPPSQRAGGEVFE